MLLKLLPRDLEPTYFGYPLQTLESLNLKRLAIVTDIPRNTLRYRMYVKHQSVKEAITHTPYVRT